MNEEDIKAFEDEIMDFNKIVVDIHCLLTIKNLSLAELQNIQEKIDKLIVRFHYFNQTIDNSVVKAKNGIEDKRKVAYKHEKYEKIFALIPILGILPALLMALRNYNLLLEAKTMEKFLTKFSGEMQTKIKIINDNIDRKYNFLNRKLLSYTGNYSMFEEKENQENYTYYNASEVIINYLDDYTFNIDSIKPQVKDAMVKLLQCDLKTDCNDLFKLLQSVKEKNKIKKLVKKA